MPAITDRAWACLAFIVACGTLVGPRAEAAPAYPLTKSASGRYLVDATGVPFMIVGDSPQALMVNISEEQADAYFANRRARGFNTVWINLLCTTYTGGRPDASTLDGIVPFLATIPGRSTYDLTTPNETYFARADRIVQRAAAYGLMVLLDPIETGGFLPTMLDNGPARCRDYGRYLGSRFANRDNILWMSGNDFQDWRDPLKDAVVLEVARGILDLDTRHLHTVLLDYLDSASLDDSNWTPIVGLNAAYSYHPTYARLLAEYARSPGLPTFLAEANYEFEALQGPTTTARILRKQEYWAMTSGATGQMYGNKYTWPFLLGWQENLDAPGALEMRFLVELFAPRAWHDLVPDVDHVVLTSGYGTYASSGYVADNDYATAARTLDGRLVIVYTPVVRPLTIDMTTVSLPALARWYDPSNGTYHPVAGSPVTAPGWVTVTPPGNNADGDGGWVLVIEPVGLDSDRDGRLDVADNCPYASNEGQSDLDGDGEGDPCDRDDGLIHLMGGDKTSITWQVESGPTRWNVYTGSLSVLRDTGVYTQAPGSNPLADARCGVIETSVDDFGIPRPGSAKFTLVAGVIGGVEGSLGFDSAGRTRPSTNPCP